MSYFDSPEIAMLQLGDLNWLDAGIGVRAWDGVLGEVSTRLDAVPVALGLRAHGATAQKVFASRDADPGFVNFCRDHLDRYGAVEVQSAAHDGGVVYWSHATSDMGVAAQDVVVFARLDRPAQYAQLPTIAIELARLVAARRERSDMRSTLSLFGAMFDRLTLGAVVVDAALWTHAPNAVCKAIFARNDGLTLWRRQLICRHEIDTKRLAETVAACLAGESRPRRAQVARARGAAPYSVFPILAGAREGGELTCLLTIVDPDTAPLIDVSRSLGVLGGAGVYDIPAQTGVRH